MKSKHTVYYVCLRLIVVIANLCFALSDDKNGYIDNARIVLYVDNDKKPHDGDIEYIAIIDENTVYVKDGKDEYCTSVKAISDVHDGVMSISFTDGSLVMLSKSALGYVSGYNKYGDTQLYILDKESYKII